MKKLLLVLLCAGGVTGCATENGQEETNVLLQQTNANLHIIKMQLTQLSSAGMARNPPSPLISQNICFLDNLAYSKGALVEHKGQQIECIESLVPDVGSGLIRGGMVWKASRADKVTQNNPAEIRSISKSTIAKKVVPVTQASHLSELK